jgi:hypothetical protein
MNPTEVNAFARNGVLLTQQQVLEIFEFSGAGLGPRVNTVLAERYGVTAKTIRDIRSGRRWGDLTTAFARTRELKAAAAAAAQDGGGALVPVNTQTLAQRLRSLPTKLERPLGFRPPPGGCTVFSAIVRFMEAESCRSSPRWNAPFLSRHPAMRRQFNFGFRANGILEVFNALPLHTRQVVENALLALQARGLALEDCARPGAATCARASAPACHPAAAAAAAAADDVGEEGDVGCLRVGFDPITQRRERVAAGPRAAALLGMHAQELSARLAAFELELPFVGLDCFPNYYYELLHAFDRTCARYMRMATGAGAARRGVLVHWTTVKDETQAR